MDFPKQQYMDIIQWTREFLESNGFLEKVALKNSELSEVQKLLENFVLGLKDTNSRIFDFGSSTIGSIKMRLRYDTDPSWVLPITLYADIPKDLREKWQSELKAKYPTGFYFVASLSVDKTISITTIAIENLKDLEDWHEPDYLQKIFRENNFFGINIEGWVWRKCCDEKGECIIDMRYHPFNTKDTLPEKIEPEAFSNETNGATGLSNLISFLKSKSFRFKSYVRNYDKRWFLVLKKF